MAWFRRKKDTDSAPGQPIPAQAPTPPIEDPRYEQWAEARRAYWSGLGAVDSDVIAYLLSPEFSGSPAWPTTRQSYVVTRGAATTILASDGMSDPFRDNSGPATGFGAEVYLESPALVGADFSAIRGSWELSALQNFAANVADIGGITGHLEQYGVVSMELPEPEGMPSHCVTPHGTVGILIGLEAPGRPTTVEVAPGERIAMIPVTLITPEETGFIVEGGAAARKELAQRLAATGVGVVSDINRPSVI